MGKAWANSDEVSIFGAQKWVGTGINFINAEKTEFERSEMFDMWNCSFLVCLWWLWLSLVVWVNESSNE